MNKQVHQAVINTKLSNSLGTITRNHHRSKIAINKTIQDYPTLRVLGGRMPGFTSLLVCMKVLELTSSLVCMKVVGIPNLESTYTRLSNVLNKLPDNPRE